MKTIIVGINFTEYCTFALKAAKTLGDKFNIPVKAVYAFPSEYVFNVVSKLTPNVKNDQSEIEKTLRIRLDKFVEDAEVDGVKTEVWFGDRESVFLELEQKNEECLFVFGAERKSILKKIFLGSFISKMINITESPVLAIRNNDFDNLKNIFSLSDMSEMGEKIMAVSNDFAAKFSANNKNVHFVTPTNIEDKTGAHSYDELLEAGEEKANNYFKEKGEFEVIKTMNFNPAKDILSKVKEEKPELVVFSATGKSRLKKLALGSVASELIHGLETNFLILK